MTSPASCKRVEGVPTELPQVADREHKASRAIRTLYFGKLRQTARDYVRRDVQCNRRCRGGQDRTHWRVLQQLTRGVLAFAVAEEQRAVAVGDTLMAGAAVLR